jgi:hypothetical protein
LFTRLNPTWNQDIGWFGTLESLAEYRSQNPDAKAKDIFQCYLKGWNHDGKVFRGMWDAGTVTGHPNKSRLPGAVQRGSPRYGIQTIMEEMIRAGVFRRMDDSPLQFCAINNAVKCAGSLPKWNPSASMYKNCDYYGKELDILAPHILVAFGSDTDGYLRAKLHNRFLRDDGQTTIVLQDGARCRYFLFLHPLGLGKNTWRGDNVRHLAPDMDVNRDLGQKEEEQFRSGPGGSTTSRLFRYTLYLVSHAKRLREGIAVP